MAEGFPCDSRTKTEVFIFPREWAARLLVYVVVSFLLAIAAGNAVASLAYATDGQAEQEGNNEFTLGEDGGYLAGEMASNARVYKERRFGEPGGHGFAAEEANNFIDRLKGMDAEVVGYDNVANGPDRKIVNRDGSTTWIQDKYYATAKGSVDAAFDSKTKGYRYVKNGEPMALEVPADQYDEAVALMKKRINEGRVPGVDNPAEAENLVRKGSLTYEQAVNLTKAGSITSLKYDAARGLVIAAPAAGISFTIDYLLCIKAGMPVGSALGESAKNAVVNGSAVFAAHVLSSQLMKTGLNGAMTPAADKVTAWLGDDACRAIVKAGGTETAGLSRTSLAKAAGNVLKSKVTFNVVFVAVLSVPDALDLFHGRMSQGQFVKNLATLVISMAGAEVGMLAGGAAGNCVVPGAGAYVGGFLGGAAGGLLGATAADLIGDKFFKDDADAMYEIVSNKFSEYCNAYIADNKEAEALAAKLNERLGDDGLKDMFASEDRDAYADDLIKPLFEEMASARSFEELPETDYELRASVLNELNGIVFIH